MTYFPAVTHDLSTTEHLTGEFIEGKRVYRKLVKHSGSMTASSTTSIAHGITGITKVVGCWGTLLRSNGATYPLVFHPGGIFAAPHFGTHVTATDIVITLGTAWTGTGNVLSDAWVVLEYLK